MDYTEQIRDIAADAEPAIRKAGEAMRALVAGFEPTEPAEEKS
jgi:hypothetical protein